jgi:hypothetical protein
MTRRRSCPAAPGPLEEYAARFDDLFGSLAQRRGFREYLAGLLAPRDRNKMLTVLAGAEPVAGAASSGRPRACSPRGVKPAPAPPADHMARRSACTGHERDIPPHHQRPACTGGKGDQQQRHLAMPTG